MDVLYLNSWVWKAWPPTVRIRRLKSDWWLSLWGFLKLLGMRRKFQLELLCFVGEYHKSTSHIFPFTSCQFPQTWVLLCMHVINEWVSPLCASSLLPLETRAKISSVRTMLGFCSPEQIIRLEGPGVETQLPILLTLAVFGRTLTYLFDSWYLCLCPGEGNGNPHWYSCLENPMDRRDHGSRRVRHIWRTLFVKWE